MTIESMFVYGSLRFFQAPPLRAKPKPIAAGSVFTRFAARRRTIERALPRHSWFILGLTVLLALETATFDWAWGRLGHRVIARLAKQHMTEKARDALAELLEPGDTSADASTWADEN